MTKPIIVKRATKGSALTYTELDTNFQNLDDATITLQAGTGGTNVISDLNGTITLVAGSGVSISGDNTAKTVTIASSESQNIFQNIAVAGQSTVSADTTSDTLTLVAGTNITLTTNATTDTITIASSASGLTDIVNDTTPQLGGNLDVNGQSIVSASNGNITLAPNGTGDVVLTTDRLLFNETGVNTIEKTSTGDLKIKTSGASSILTLQGEAGVDITDASGSAIIRFNVNDGVTPTGTSISGSTGGTIITGSNYIALNAGYTSFTTTGGNQTQLQFVVATTDAPTNTSSINGWIKISVAGVNKWIPYYA
jgi:hypothetical protein